MQGRDNRPKEKPAKKDLFTDLLETMGLSEQIQTLSVDLALTEALLGETESARQSKYKIYYNGALIETMYIEVPKCNVIINNETKEIFIETKNHKKGVYDG